MNDKFIVAYHCTSSNIEGGATTNENYRIEIYESGIFVAYPAVFQDDGIKRYSHFINADNFGICKDGKLHYMIRNGESAANQPTLFNHLKDLFHLITTSKWSMFDENDVLINPIGITRDEMITEVEMYFMRKFLNRVDPDLLTK